MTLTTVGPAYDVRPTVADIPGEKNTLGQGARSHAKIDRQIDFGVGAFDRKQPPVIDARFRRNRLNSEVELLDRDAFQAIDDMKTIDGNLMRRVRLMVDDWSEHLHSVADRLSYGSDMQTFILGADRYVGSAVINCELPAFEIRDHGDVRKNLERNCKRRFCPRCDGRKFCLAGPSQRSRQ